MKRVVLCMICRDESPVIERCLNSVKPLIQAWAVCDTGSLDDTPEKVMSCLSDLPGVLQRDVWADFSTNRNRSLELARAVARAHDCDGILLIDSDEELQSDGHRWEDLDPEADGHQIMVSTGPQQFPRILVMRADVPWMFRGVVHEQALVDGRPAVVGMADRLFVRSHGDGGRSRRGNKFETDLAALEAWLEHPPADASPGEIARTTGYTANVARCAGKLDRALELHRKRVTMGGFDQEVFFSKLEIARILEYTKATEAEVIGAYLAAIDDRPSRAEGAWYLGRYLSQRGLERAGSIFGIHASRLPMSRDVTFVEPRCYGASANVRIGIITAPRDGFHPLGVTLTSAIGSDDLVRPQMVKVFWDGPADRAPGVPVQVEAATPEALALIKQGGRYGTLNLIRALRWCAEAGGIVVTLEDDLTFAQHWLKRGIGLLQAAEAKLQQPCIVSLHDMFDPATFEEIHKETGITCGDDELWEVTPRTSPNGSQCYVMGADTARRLAAVLTMGMGKRTADERKAWAMDVGVLRACLQCGVARLLFSRQNRVCHIHQTTSTWANQDPRWLNNDAAHLPYRATKRFNPS